MATNASQRQSGFTLIELLLVLGLGGLIFAGLLTQYSDSVALSYNQNIKISTNLQVQAILQNIGAELRILGNGVPFDQANFQIGDTTLTDPLVTEPIQVATAAANLITFRLNETGTVHLLTQDFNPALTRQIYLTDVNGLDVNDPIYITNSVVSLDDGFYGIIEQVHSGSNSITVAEGFVSSREIVDDVTIILATFPMGSVLEEVPLVTFNSPVDGSGVTRDSGFGPVTLGAGSSMTLQYLNQNGVELALPLTNVAVVNALRAIRVTVTMQSSKPLKNGQFYSATASQVFGIRNLNYVF